MVNGGVQPRAVVMNMSASCCNHIDDPHRGHEDCRRVLWAVLGSNAAMFAVEVIAGLVAGSASLQADALDFLGDAATTPSVGVAALLANALSFVLLWAYREGDANMRWICTRNDVLGNLAMLLAAIGVFGWPDVIVVTIMSGLALQGGSTSASSRRLASRMLQSMAAPTPRALALIRASQVAAEKAARSHDTRDQVKVLALKRAAETELQRTPGMGLPNDKSWRW
jgi:Co/Zn/Cd efflux system component